MRALFHPEAAKILLAGCGITPASSPGWASEYQYYEFQAIDRRLTDAEMQALRTYSTRAQITPTVSACSGRRRGWRTRRQL